MSAAATAELKSAAKGGRNKLIILIVVALLVLAGGGGAAFMVLKKPPADAEEDDSGDGGHAKANPHAKAEAVVVTKHDPKHPPVFVPLDPFTVNLADTNAERYAQVGVTLEIIDAKVGDELKAVMPAVRNNILMLLSARTAAQLLSREGKEKLAQSIRYASVRPLGYDIDDPEDEDEAATEDAPRKKKKKKRKVPANLPVTDVHFSNFIVQ